VGSKNEEDENEVRTIDLCCCRIAFILNVELGVDLTRSLTHVAKKELLAFSGDDLPVSYHGFLGLDAELGNAIASWIKAAATPNV